MCHTTEENPWSIRLYRGFGSRDLQMADLRIVFQHAKPASLRGTNVTSGYITVLSSLHIIWQYKLRKSWWTKHFVQLFMVHFRALAIYTIYPSCACDYLPQYLHHMSSCCNPISAGRSIKCWSNYATSSESSQHQRFVAHVLLIPEWFPMLL